MLSGYRGDNIFYEKYFFRGDTVHGFGIEFPAGGEAAATRRSSSASRTSFQRRASTSR